MLLPSFYAKQQKKENIIKELFSCESRRREDPKNSIVREIKGLIENPSLETTWNSSSNNSRQFTKLTP